MPVVEKLDQQVELRFYRHSGMSASTIFARRESRIIEYQPRGFGQTVTRVERARYIIHANSDISANLTRAEVAGPVRVFANGVEYVVTGLEETERRDRVIVHGEAFPSGQR